MASNRVLPQKTRLQKVLECPLCLHHLEHPKQMQHCFHAFCDQCLDELPLENKQPAEDFPCPVCETFGIPLQADKGSFLDDLMDIQNFDQAAAIICKQCPDKPKSASAVCEECKFELCDNCTKIHVEIPFLRNHHVIPLDEQCMKRVDRLFLCNNHGMPLQMNCQDCDQLICATCIFVSHNTHSVEPLAAKEDRLVALLTKQKDIMSNFCDVLVSKIHLVRKKIDDTDSSYQIFVSALETQCDNMPALKERLKHVTVQQQKQEIESLEGMKHYLECQLAKGEHLQYVGAVILQYGRSTSLINEIKNGFLRCVQEFNETKRKDQLILRILLPSDSTIKSINKRPEEPPPELHTYLDNVIVSPCGHVVQFEQAKFNYTKLFRRKLMQEARIGPLEQQFRMTYISDRLWLPQNQRINIYLQAGEPEKLIECNRNVTVVRKAHNGHIMLAGDQGLSYKTSKEGEAIHITEGFISDISCYAFETAVFKTGESAVEIYELSDKFACDVAEKDCQWKLKNVFKVKISSSHTTDTLLLTQTHVFFSTIINKKLLKYTKDGILVDSLNLHVSCLLAGTDIDNNILLCRFSKTGGFRLLNQNLEYILEEVLPNEIRYPLDTVIDNEHNMWILQGCPRERVAYSIRKVIVK